MSLPPTLTTLAALAVILIPIFTFVEQARKIAVGIYRWLFRLIAPAENPHRVDLKITPDRTGLCFWSEGSVSGKPSMIVRCQLHVANVGPCAVFQILDVYIKKPKTHGIIFPNGSQRTNPRLPKLPPDTRLAEPVDVMFTVEPPTVRSGEKFVSNLVLVDQFGRKHPAKKVEFRALGGAGWATLKAQLQAAKQPKP